MDWQHIADMLQEDADPKQLIPLYGIVKITEDMHEDKPTIADDPETLGYWWTGIYHGSGVSTFGFLGNHAVEYVSHAASYLPV